MLQRVLRLFTNMSGTSLPPGLEGDLLEATAGGSGEWAAFEKKKWYTNAFVFDPSGSKVRPAVPRCNALLRDFTAVTWAEEARLWRWSVSFTLLSLHTLANQTCSYNGFGGKVDPGETPAEAAKRELQVSYSLHDCAGC